MKKKTILTIICLALSVVLLCSCSTASSIFSGSYWLTSHSNYGIASIDETLTYSVAFNQNEGENLPKVVVDGANSSFVTKLSDSSYEGTRCYLFETILTVKGEITYNEEKTALNDSITTKAYFLGLSEELEPLYSERIVSARSIYAKATGYAIDKYDYTITSKYSNTTATVTFSPSDDCVDDFNLAKGDVEYTDYNKETYIDNELLLFAPRAMALDESFSTKLTSINALSKLNNKLLFRTDTTKSTELFEFNKTDKTYYRNNEFVPSVSTYVLNYTIDSTYPGSPIKTYYATSGSKNQRSSLIQLETSTVVGSFVYTIKLAEVSEG